MNKAFRILLAVLLVQLSLQASAQEKKLIFQSCQLCGRFADHSS